MLQLGKYELIEAKFEEFDFNCIPIFEEIKKVITLHIPDVIVEHIGSSSIELRGKNIIDCLLICKTPNFNSVLYILEKIGFQLPPYKIPDKRPLRVASVIYNNKKYFTHIRLTHLNSEDHRKYIFFRDYLKSHKDLAEQYEVLKKSIIESGKLDVRKYNKQKEEFIKAILNKKSIII